MAWSFWAAGDSSEALAAVAPDAATSMVASRTAAALAPANPRAGGLTEVFRRPERLDMENFIRRFLRRSRGTGAPTWFSPAYYPKSHSHFRQERRAPLQHIFRVSPGDGQRSTSKCGPAPTTRQGAPQLAPVDPSVRCGRHGQGRQPWPADSCQPGPPDPDTRPHGPVVLPLSKRVLDKSQIEFPAQQ